MLYENLVLQNAFSRSGRAQPRIDLDRIRERLQVSRELTAQEADALLSESMWSRPSPRTIGEFADNHSTHFRLFRIY